MEKILLLSLLYILIAGVGAGVSVGAAPGSIEFGTVEPGTTIEQDIYVRSPDAEENFTIDPSANTISPSTLFSGGLENKNEISEQSPEPWFSFEEMTVNPDTAIPRSEIDIPNVPEMNGVSQMTLEIPEGAEPGYRYGSISLNPEFSDLNQSGTGARIVTPTRITFSLRVAGNVERNIVVQDVRGFRTEQETASVELLLSNQGTVTASTENFDVDILSQQGNEVSSLTVSGLTLEPGESEWTSAYWSGGSVDEGTYQVDGQVDYMTGSAYASGSFSLADVVEVRPSDSPTTDDETEQDGGSVPIWFVVIVLTILGVLMWGFEIEPFWIVAILGVVGISAFILLSGLPNFLLAVLLIMVGIIIYGGM